MFSEWFFPANLPTWAILLELIVCGALICVAGARCTRAADLISDMLNLGKAWTGLLLLAGITSLPEVVTGITAVSIRQPDLAFGNIFGSCMFNVAIIVILDGLLRSGSVLRDANPAHGLSSSMGIVLMVLAVLGMTLVAQATQQVTTVSPAVLESLFCVAIAGTYFACMRLSFRFERQLHNNAQPTLADAAAKRDRTIYRGTEGVVEISGRIGIGDRAAPPL